MHREHTTARNVLPVEVQGSFAQLQHIFAGIQGSVRMHRAVLRRYRTFGQNFRALGGYTGLFCADIGHFGGFTGLFAERQPSFARL